MSTQKVVLTKEQRVDVFINLLAQNRYKKAARIAWPWFEQNDWTDKIWEAIEKYDRLCIMGHGSASKTFTASVWFLLDWIANAHETALILTSSTIASMDRRIWADFKTLWTKSKVDLTTVGQILDAKRMIRQSIMEGKAAVHAVAAESDDAETKIQGIHLPRTRVIFDEADNPYSSSIWPALTNLGTSGHLKVVALANPVDRNSEFGFHCEPVDGYDTVSPDRDYEWEGKLGWHILRLDGLESPNIKLGHDKYSYLLSNKSLIQTRDDKGTQSPEWWTMIRAFYPPDGTVNNIFPGGLIGKCNKAILWYGTTTPIGFCDPAFEGGDNCMLYLGKLGRVAEKPERTAVEVEQVIKIKRRDMEKTLGFDFADQIVAHLTNHKVLPKYFGIDTTGTQGPFADIIEEKLGKGLQRVLFGNSASTRRVTNEDTVTADQLYKNFVTELWYVAREWCRFGLVYIPKVPRELRIQLESRHYKLTGRSLKTHREMIQAEPKTDMKSRGLGSPDDGDAFCGLIHVARLHSSGFTPGSFKDKAPDQKKKIFAKNASIFKMDYGVPDK